MNTNINLDYFKKMFLAMLKDYKIGEINQELQNVTQGDEVDNAMEEREKQILIRLQGRDILFLKKVREALFRINDGTFGICEECNGLIDERRLLARPTTTCCIACKEQKEREEDQIPYYKRSKTLGKTFTNVINFPNTRPNEGFNFALVAGMENEF